MAAFALNILQVSEEWSSKGFGLMALAVGVLPNVHKLDLSVMSQQEIEVHAEGLQMLSMIVLTNNVRLDSRPSVTQLQERYHCAPVFLDTCRRITILVMHPMSGSTGWHNTGLCSHTSIHTILGPYTCLFCQVVKASCKHALCSTPHSFCHMLCRGGIRTIMITGDYPHAALVVAKDVGMLKPEGQVVVINAIDHPRAASEPHVQQSFRMPSPPPAHSVDLRHDITYKYRHVSMPSLPVPHARPPQLRHVSFNTPTEPHHHSTSLPMASARSSSPETSLTDPGGSACHGGGVLTLPCRNQDPMTRLSFVVEASHQSVEAHEAVRALSEGRMECALTGDSFEFLLQHCDLSVFDVVMRNTVVFARMKPHQKGQVMDLLGSRGLHSVTDGHTHHIQVSTVLHYMRRLHMLCGAAHTLHVNKCITKQEPQMPK